MRKLFTHKVKFEQGDDVVIKKLERIADLYHDLGGPRSEYESVIRNYDSISVLGIQSPVVLRLLPSGEYTVVDGKSRIAIAKVLKISQLPTVIEDLGPDDSVPEDIGRA